MSVNHDDLLKILYVSEQRGNTFSGTDVSRELGISPSGLTRMIARMHEEGLLEYRPYRTVLLSEKGREKAAGILRKHRLWESFLSKVLNMKWNEVHREADMLEHQTSDALCERLDKFLGHPAYDPHGEPIPDRNGKIRPRRDTLLLSEGETGKSYLVAGVSDRSDALMDYFTDIGLKLQSHIRILERIPMDHSLIVSVNTHKTILSQTIAENIYICADF